MSHRGFVMEAFDLYFKDIDLKGKKVLDVGCEKEFLKERLESYGLEWYGLDIKYDGENKLIINGPMEKMPLPDNEFDMVFVCHSFEHCENPISALREFKRVSKEWIFIATPSPCKKQILDGDDDHIFVLNTMQMQRLFQYVEIPMKTIYLQTKTIHKEQDYNVISIGRNKVD